MKKLLAKKGIVGYDVGWDIWSPLDKKWVKQWWGNTKDSRSFMNLVGDLEEKGYEFDFDISAYELIEGRL